MYSFNAELALGIIQNNLDDAEDAFVIYDEDTHIATLHHNFQQTIVFPELIERSDIENLIVSGAQNLSIVTDDLHIGYQTMATITMVESGAGYNNSLGAYTILADGSISAVEMAFKNVKDGLTARQISAIDRGINKNDQKIERYNDDIEDDLKEIANLQNKIDGYNAEKLSIDPAGKHFDKDIAKLDKNIQKSLNKISKAESHIEQYQGKIQSYLEANETLKSEKDALIAAQSFIYSVSGEENSEIGFFIIANGDRVNGGYDDLDFENGTLEFIYGLGTDSERTAKITDAANDVSLVYRNGDNEKVLNGNIYHTTEDGASTAINPDNTIHAISGLAEAGNDDVLRIGFEDLKNLGDADFNDVVFDITIATKTVDLTDFINTDITGSNNDDMLVVSTLNGNIDGLSGRDTANFEALDTGITLALNGGTVQLTGSGDIYTILNIENVNGTNFNDSIIGTNERNILNGLDGNDDIRGLGGNDLITGGAGNNELLGNDGNDTIYGGNGDDRIFGDGRAGQNESGKDTIYGEAGNDILYGGDDNDTIYGGAGNDIIYGDKIASTDIFSGDDKLYGGDGNDTVYGDAGNDLINGGIGQNILTGGTGVDTFEFTVIDPSNQIDYIRDFNVSQGDAIDVSGLILNFDPATDTLSKYVSITQNASHSFLWVNADGKGTDTIMIARIDGVTGLNVNTLYASGNLIIDTDNTVTGDNAANTLYGYGGDDVIDGHDGDDTIYGGSGNDIIDGGLGRDSIFGGAGADTFVLGIETGTIDIIRDFNALEGDVLDLRGITTNFDPATTHINSYISISENSIGTFIAVNSDGQGSNYQFVARLDGVFGLDRQTLLNNGNLLLNEDDVKTGTADADTLRGNGGNDTLSGLGGDDILYGDAGDDVLIGGLGRDSLTGGSGADRFVFTDDDTSLDLVRDFNAGEGDILDITDIINNEFDPVTDSITKFVSVTEAAGHSYLRVDATGQGTDFNKIVARLDNVTGIDVQDLLDNGNLIL